MATSQATIDRLTETLGDGEYLFKKMFGEYALYLNGKVVALVCDNQLYIEPSSGDEEFRGSCASAPPYPGAKAYWQAQDSLWSRAWLIKALAATEDALPAPKPKKKK